MPAPPSTTVHFLRSELTTRERNSRTNIGFVGCSRKVNEKVIFTTDPEQVTCPQCARCNEFRKKATGGIKLAAKQSMLVSHPWY